MKDPRGEANFCFQSELGLYIAQLTFNNNGEFEFAMISADSSDKGEGIVLYVCREVGEVESEVVFVLQDFHGEGFGVRSSIIENEEGIIGDLTREYGLSEEGDSNDSVYVRDSMVDGEWHYMGMPAGSVSPCGFELGMSYDSVNSA